GALASRQSNRLTIRQCLVAPDTQLRRPPFQPREKAMDDSQFSAEKSQKRLHKILKGAFDGPPTPLKEIRKVNGGAPQIDKRIRDSGISDASSKTAPQRRKNTG